MGVIWFAASVAIAICMSHFVPDKPTDGYQVGALVIMALAGVSAFFALIMDIAVWLEHFDR